MVYGPCKPLIGRFAALITTDSVGAALHQLRHTYATALINAGVSLEALMALLWHSSAAMSLRYGRLFDATVRADYERALGQAKDRLGPVLPDAPADQPNGDWRELPLIKSRLAGGLLRQDRCARHAATQETAPPCRAVNGAAERALTTRPVSRCARAPTRVSAITDPRPSPTLARHSHPLLTSRSMWL
ncbi:MAG: tyrosine-type recombinase/integrase [Nitriliruptorales bacterium]|nr:tyrosine-type recombinase/integrase [Nitriliruptorales bacterium]